MANTIRSVNELLTFFHDNTTRDITPQMMRDFVVTANSWVAGSQLFYGAGAPDNGEGVEGSFYLDITDTVLYGPKGEFIWPDGISLIGADSTVPGPEGEDGTDGRTILNGTSNPTGGVGDNGDFYINTVSSTLFGPKASGSWPSGVSLVGPAGTNGTNGQTVLNGSIDPTTEGVDGDFYINTATNFLFGPKASGTWPSGVSLVGPAGEDGAATMVWNETPSGDIDGDNRVFELDAAPQSGKLMLFRDGMLMREGSGNDYVISGDTITFEVGNAPANGAILLATYQP